MRKVRYWLTLFVAFWQRFKRLILFSMALGVLVFLFLPRALPTPALIFSQNKVGLVGRFTPEELPLSIQREISLGLTTVDEELNISPGLAVEWSAQEEGRVWIFKLGDARWQDGKPVEAKDINYNFADVETEVLDETTIKFRLRDPFAPFPSVVSRPVFRKGLLGAGEWRVTKLSFANRQFVESLRLKSVNTEEEKIYKFYPTEEAARTAFKLGEVNILREIVDPEELREWNNLEIEEVIREDRYVGIFLNINEPLVQDKNLRQALAYAINKEKFVGKRATSPVSPKSWAFNPQVKPYAYNVERAKELLGKPDPAFSINLVTTPSLLTVADKVKEDWEAVGMETHIQVSNTPPANYEAMIAIQAIPIDPDQYSLWHSTQAPTNITNYGEQQEENKPRESPRIDKLLEDGRRTLNQNERRQIYLDFQRFIVEDSPVIFLYHPTTYTIIRR